MAEVFPLSSEACTAIIVFIAFLVFAGGLPEPVGLKIKGLLHTEKARESVPVARPTLRGLRIALSDRTSNAEAHAVYVYAYKSAMQAGIRNEGCIEYTHEHLLLPCSRPDLEVCEVSKCQEQSVK